MDLHDKVMSMMSGIVSSSVSDVLLSKKAEEIIAVVDGARTMRKIDATVSAEQEARELLDRMGVPTAQNFPSWRLVELANLIVDARRESVDTAVTEDPHEAARQIGYLCVSGEDDYPILVKTDQEALWQLSHSGTKVDMVEFRVLAEMEEHKTLRAKESSEE